MNYRSLADLAAALRRNLDRLPDDVDAVLGIPRSGMLAASLAALLLERPLGDFDGFLDGRLLAVGQTRGDGKAPAAAACRRVLVIDDSVHTGASARAARARLAAARPDVEAIFAAVFGARARHEAVDVVLETVAMPRLFEWNLMHHPDLVHCALDIDGVLCRDPDERENDDGPRYRRFLETVPPLVRPSRPVGALVSSRLEKYRGETEAWLARHGIAYGALHLLDLPDHETRRRLGVHGRFKAEVYRDLPSRLFVESDAPQAEEIARLSGKPALAWDRQVLVSPDPASLIAFRQTLVLRGRGAAHQLARLRKLPARLRRWFGG